MPAEFDPQEVELLFEGLREAGPKALEYMGFDFWAEATREAPIRRGTLRGSIQAMEQGEYQWIVGTDLEYSLYVHEGHLTRPAMGGSYLGKKVGTGHAQHWVEGNPFFDRAIETIEGRSEEYITLATEGIN